MNKEWQNLIFGAVVGSITVLIYQHFAGRDCKCSDVNNSNVSVQSQGKPRVV